MTHAKPVLADCLVHAAAAVSLVVALGSVGAAPALADDGRALLDQAAQRNGTASWHDRTLEVTIESRSGDSTTRTREAEVAERVDPDGGHRTFIEFTAPADVEGTLYLHLLPHDEDEQEWVYAPAARRPRRLTPGQSDETSTGAELGYREVERVTQLLAARDAQVQRAGEETVDGRTFEVVRVTPRVRAAGAGASYDLWLDAGDLRLHKLVAKGGAAQEVLLGDYAVIDGHATPLLVDVVGPDGGWRTVFRLRDVKYDVGVKDDTFSLARLNRGR